jgi:hypothetical protein
MLDVSQTTNNIEYTDKLRYIQDRIVQATWNGDNPRLRQQYYHDYNFFLESLTRIGFELLEYNGAIYTYLYTILLLLLI